MRWNSCSPTHISLTEAARATGTPRKRIQREVAKLRLRSIDALPDLLTLSQAARLCVTDHGEIRRLIGTELSAYREELDNGRFRWRISNRDTRDLARRRLAKTATPTPEPALPPGAPETPSEAQGPAVCSPILG